MKLDRIGRGIGSSHALPVCSLSLVPNNLPPFRPHIWHAVPSSKQETPLLPSKAHHRQPSSRHPRVTCVFKNCRPRFEIRSRAPRQEHVEGDQVVRRVPFAVYPTSVLWLHELVFSALVLCSLRKSAELSTSFGFGESRHPTLTSRSSRLFELTP